VDVIPDNSAVLDRLRCFWAGLAPKTDQAGEGSERGTAYDQLGRLTAVTQGMP